MENQTLFEELNDLVKDARRIPNGNKIVLSLLHNKEIPASILVAFKEYEDKFNNRTQNLGEMVVDAVLDSYNAKTITSEEMAAHLTHPAILAGIEQLRQLKLEYDNQENNKKN